RRRRHHQGEVVGSEAAKARRALVRPVLRHDDDPRVAGHGSPVLWLERVPEALAREAAAGEEREKGVATGGPDGDLHGIPVKGLTRDVDGGGPGRAVRRRRREVTAAILRAAARG